MQTDPDMTTVHRAPMRAATDPATKLPNFAMHLAGELDEAQFENGLGEAIDQPSSRQPRHPGADEGDRLSGEEEAVIAMAKRPQRESPTGGRILVVLCHEPKRF